MTPDSIHPTSEELFAYRDGELPAEKRALLEAHVTSCRACRERIDRVSGLEAALKQRPDPVEGDYYAALSRSVLRKIGAKEPAPGEAGAREAGAAGAASPGAAAREGDAREPDARPEGPARERRREGDAEDPRLSRAPGLPWAALISTMAAASAVIVVVVMLVRQGGPENKMLATGPRATAPLGGAPPAAPAPTGAAPEAPASPGAEVVRQEEPAPAKKQLALGTQEEAAPGGAAGQAAPMAASRPSNEPPPPERLSEGALRKDEDRARVAAEAESRARARAAAPSAKGLPLAADLSTASPYQALVRRFGLPDVWAGGSVSRDALLRAEPDLRTLYIAGRAGSDSARVRLYLAEAARLRYETDPDSALFDSVVHHYWRAIRLAGEQADVARTARERLESFRR
jgi:hypothetical protein